MTPRPFQSARTTALDLAAAVVVAVGGVALLGWMLDAPALAAWKAGNPPMAPATALLAMFAGVTLWLRAHGPTERSGMRAAATILAWTGSAASLMLLVLRLSSTYWPAELLGLRLTDPALDPTTGFVSPITAVGFLLVNATLLRALPLASLGTGRRWFLIVTAGAIAASGFVLMLVAIFGPPLLSRVGILPVAVNTSLVFLIIGLAVLVMDSRILGEGRVSPGGVWQGMTVYAAIFAAVAALAIAGAYSYYRAEERAVHAQAEQELQTLSRLKVSQLREWRLERLADARGIFQNPLVAGLSRRLLNEPRDGAARRDLEEWWALNQAHLQSDRFTLTDANGIAILSAPSGPAAPSAVIAAAADGVVRRGEVTLVDFYLDEQDHRAYLATMVPIVDAPPASATIGVLMLRLDPDRFLYPFIASLPGGSTSAETLLVRREGEAAQFLNPTRFDPDASLRRRISLSERQVLAVKAVTGQTGLVEGLDYRGTPVMGVLSAVPGSPWFLIAKKDTADFRTDLWSRFWIAAIFSILALSGTAAGLGLVWRDQAARLYRSQAQLADALRQSEERYRSYVESATDSIFELNTAGLVTFVSPNWSAIMGEPRSAAIGKPLERYVHPDDVPLCRAYFEEVLASAESTAAGIEYRALNLRDGSFRWYSARGAPLRDGDGNVTGGLGIARDITDRVEADRQAERVKERLELATRAAGIGIWDWDILSGAIVWDDRMFQLYGWRPNAFHVDYGRWMAGVHPDDRARVDRDVRQALPGTVSYVSRFRAVWPDGTVRRIAAVGHVTTDEEGRPVRMLGVNYDVTEREENAEQLRRSQALLQMVIDSTSDAIYVKDLHGGYLLFNAAAEHVTGKCAAEVLGHDDRFLFPAEEAETVMAGDWNVLAGGHVTTYTERVSDAAGRMRVFESTKGPLRDATGTIIGLFGVARDVTERLAAEAELREQKQFLESLLQSAPIGFAVNTIDDGHVVFVSRRFEEIYGVAHDSLHSVDDFFEQVFPDPSYREMMRERILADLASGEPARMRWEDMAITTQAGEVRAVSAINIPLPEQNLMISTVQDVTARKRAEEATQTLLREKEALLREVHHRVKNNLQVITSLLRLEAERARQPATIRVLGEMRDRILAMASLHESLYRSNEFETVNLADYVRRVSTQLFHSSEIGAGRIELGFDLEPAYVQIHQAIPCGLLVNELVSNSLKHGFPDGRSGHIDIGLHVIDAGVRLRLVVRDTGVGLPADFDERPAGSLGLQLVVDLARQLRGEIEISPGPGAEFRLAFTPDLVHSGAANA